MIFIALRIYVLLFAFFVAAADCHALEISEQFTISGVLAGAYQYQDADGDKDLGRGAVPLQLELSYEPGENDFFSPNSGLRLATASMTGQAFPFHPGPPTLRMTPGISTAVNGTISSQPGTCIHSVLAIKQLLPLLAA